MESYGIHEWQSEPDVAHCGTYPASLLDSGFELSARRRRLRKDKRPTKLGRR